MGDKDVAAAIDAAAVAVFMEMDRLTDRELCLRVARAAVEAYKEALYQAYSREMDLGNEERAIEIVRHAFDPPRIRINPTPIS
jgi:hypothetical protein